MSDVLSSCAHSLPLPLSCSFCPLLGLPPRLAPNPPSPQLPPSSPLSASHPGSRSLVQLGQCNLLKKKPYNLVNHTSRRSGQGGEGGAGLGGPHPQLRALVQLYLSLRTPAYSLGLHSAANRVQSSTKSTKCLYRGFGGSLALSMSRFPSLIMGVGLGAGGVSLSIWSA